MELTVYWTQFAESRLEEIFNYYKYRVSVNVARRLVKGIVDKTIDLEHQPYKGQKEELLKQRAEDFRYLVYKSYKITISSIPIRKELRLSTFLIAAGIRRR